MCSSTMVEAVATSAPNTMGATAVSNNRQCNAWTPTVTKPYLCYSMNMNLDPIASSVVVELTFDENFDFFPIECELLQGDSEADF